MQRDSILRLLKLLLLISNGLSRAFAGSCIRLGLLTANGQALTMANSAIAADFGESLDVHGDLSSQITLDNLSFSDHFGNLLDFVIGEILDSRVRIHAGLGQNSVGTRHTDTIDIGESDFNTLLSR